MIGSRRRNSAHSGDAPRIATTRKASPSLRYKFAQCASQSRVAFSNMAWNTGFELSGRAGDDAQDLRCRRLLLQRLLQLALAGLLRLEQPCVLDGDDGLISKDLDELDLPFRKGL